MYLYKYFTFITSVFLRERYVVELNISLQRDFKGWNMIFLINWFVVSKAASWKLKKKQYAI